MNGVGQFHQASFNLLHHDHIRSSVSPSYFIAGSLSRMIAGYPNGHGDIVGLKIGTDII
jgi:hypothetical protein